MGKSIFKPQGGQYLFIAIFRSATTPFMVFLHKKVCSSTGCRVKKISKIGRFPEQKTTKVVSTKVVEKQVL